jgi:tryptophan synthase alpha chain
MSISKTFQELHKRSEGALIAFITGGDPSPNYTPKIAEALIKGGADLLEIGVPFSDPIADGPIIQAADYRALKAGTTPQTIFDIVKETKKSSNIPIVLLTYYNILFRMGVKNFLKKAREYSVDGLVIPDLPIEEADEYIEIARKEGVDTIFLATPATSISRLTKILHYTTGFLYLVSIFGVTGTRTRVTKFTIDTVKRIHPHTVGVVPLAVGFGLSKPEHVKAVISYGAEGAIVGSAFVKIVEEDLENPARIVDDVYAFAEKLKAATLRKTLKMEKAEWVID